MKNYAALAAALSCALLPTYASAQSNMLIYVADSEDAPVPGAQLSLDLQPVDGTPEFTTTSSVFGFASVADVPVGTYTLSVLHPSYTSYSEVGVIFDGTDPVRKKVTLEGGGGEPRIDLYFDVVGAHTSARLDNTMIQVKRWATSDTTGVPASNFTLQTDDAGQVGISLIEPGYFSYSFDRAGWEPMAASAPALHTSSQIIRVGLKPTYADLIVDVSGFDPRGADPQVGALENVTVEITGVDLVDNDIVLVPMRSELTPDTGLVTFHHLPQIVWKVRVMRLGYVDHEELIFSNFGGGYPQTSVNLILDAQSITFGLESLYSGYEYFDGAEITLRGLERANTEGIERTEFADARGMVTFDNILPGMFNILVAGLETQITNLPTSSGTLLPGPLGFTVVFSPAEASIEVQQGKATVDTVEMGVIPATVRVQLVGAFALEPEDAEWAHPARLFESITSTDVRFEEHETSLGTFDLPVTPTFVTEPDGSFIATIIPGRYGIIIPDLADYSGHGVVFEDPSGEFADGELGWPYPQVWPFGNFEPEHHASWMHFSSDVDYRLRLELHKNEINWRQIIDWDFTTDPCHHLTVAFRDPGTYEDPVNIDWMDLVHGGGQGTLAGTAAASANMKVTSGRGEALFTALQPGNYTLSATHPRITFDTVPLTVLPWNAPGELPVAEPFSEGDWFPMIAWGDFSKRVIGTYVGHDLKMQVWQYNETDGQYSKTQLHTGAQYYETDFIPANTFCGPSVIGNEAPDGTYTAYRQITTDDWYKVTMSGGGTVDVYFNGGPLENVSPANAPSLAGGYHLIAKAVSDADPLLEIPDIQISFVDGTSVTSGFDGNHTGDFRVQSAVGQPWQMHNATDWTWDIQLDGAGGSGPPPAPIVTVTVRMGRNVMVRGSVKGNAIAGQAVPASGPLEGATVAVYSRRGHLLHRVKTAADGSFQTPEDIPPQGIYVGVEAPGFKPSRKRFEPADVGPTELNAGELPVDAVPLGPEPSFTIDRYGLFLPGVLKSGDAFGYDPDNAKGGLTATWSASTTSVAFDYTVDGFERGRGAWGARTYSVDDKPVMMCVVDDRAFKRPAIVAKAEDIVDNPVPWDGPPEYWEVDTVQPLPYQQVIEWLAAARSGETPDGTVAATAHSCSSTLETIDLPDGGTGPGFSGKFELWKMPPGEFLPALVVVMKSGRVGVIEYEPPGDFAALKGYRLHRWAQVFLELMGVAETYVPSIGIGDAVPEGMFVLQPSFNFAIHKGPKGYLTYDAKLAVSFVSGQSSPETGVLSTGPGHHGTKVNADDSKTSVDGGAAGFKVDGEKNTVEFSLALKSSVDMKKLVGEDGPALMRKGPIRIDLSKTSITGSAKAGIVDVVDTKWTDGIDAPRFKLRIGAAAMFKTRVAVNMLWVGARLAPAIPVAGPAISAALTGLDVAGFQGEIFSDIAQGGSVTHTTSTFFPGAGVTQERGPTLQPGVVHALGGHQRSDESKTAFKLRLLFGVGVRAAIPGGRASIEGSFQAGAPKDRNVGGVEFTINDPAWQWPPIKRVRGAISGIFAYGLKLGPVKVSRSHQYDFLEFDKTLGTDPWINVITLNSVTLINSPATATTAQFNTTGSVLVNGLYPVGDSDLASESPSPSFAYADVDDTTGEMTVMVTTDDGSGIWTAPVEVARGGGILAVATETLPAGGHIAVWAQIDAADLGNPFATSTLWYATANVAGTWSAPTMLADLGEETRSLSLVVAGSDVALIAQTGADGGVSATERLWKSVYDGTSWTVPSELRGAATTTSVATSGSGPGATSGDAWVIVGGLSGDLAAYNYDGDGTGSWTSTPSLASDAVGPAALTVLPNGDVLAVYRRIDDMLVLARWNDIAGSWSDVADLTEASALQINVTPVVQGGQPSYLVAWVESADPPEVRYIYMDEAGTVTSAVAFASTTTEGEHTDIEVRQAPGEDPTVIVTVSGDTSSAVERASLPFVAPCTEGDVCDDGQWCTVNDTCSAQGVCLGEMRDCTASICDPGFCDEDVGACTSTPLPAGTFCGSVTACGEGQCQADGSCEATVTGCDVGGSCYTAGTINPDSICQVCDPTLSSTQWSPTAEGQACAAATCDSGGQQVPAASCAAGLCAAPAAVSCGTAGCELGACRTTCTTDNDCIAPATCIDSACVNEAPIADAGPAQTVALSAMVTLDGRRSYDPDGNAITHAWTQTSGTTVELSDSTSSAPTFNAPSSVATDPETLEFSLVANDGLLDSAPSVATVDVASGDSNVAPVANIEGPATVSVGGTATFSAQGSSDSDGDALSAFWSQWSGPTVTLTGVDTMELQLTAGSSLTVGETVTLALLVHDGSANSVMALHSIDLRAASGDETPPSKKESGCGCAGTGAVGWVLMLAIAPLWRRRRRTTFG